jgi:hypothetical protein
MRLVRWRFWAEISLASASALLVVLTVAWPEWIEEVFGVDPDGGNGSLEWAIAIVFALCAIVLPIRARSEWRRARVLQSVVTPVDGSASGS